MFELFWRTWPRGLRVGKGAALKAWKKINPTEDLAKQITKAVENQKAHRARVERANELLPRFKRTFIPNWKHPATWLNQQCWLDDCPTAEEVKMPELPKKCADCDKPYTVTFLGVPYCTRCYDKHAHPDLMRA
jgi:hypothetical protein